MRVIAFSILALVCGSLGTVALIATANYSDNLIVSGSKYGLTIGMSKEEVYDRLLPAIQNAQDGSTTVFIEVEITSDISEVAATNVGTPVLIQTYLNDIGKTSFRKKDYWKLYVNGSRFNTLSLTFCEGKLCEIYRHRKSFELP